MSQRDLSSLRDPHWVSTQLRRNPCLYPILGLPYFTSYPRSILQSHLHIQSVALVLGCRAHRLRVQELVPVFLVPSFFDVSRLFSWAFWLFCLSWVSWSKKFFEIQLGKATLSLILLQSRYLRHVSRLRFHLIVHKLVSLTLSGRKFWNK